jgi:hypothetical protein
LSLYSVLQFVHLVAVAVFLFGHGVAAAASLLLRRPVAQSARQVLELSRRSAMVSNPALLVIIASGVWMGFAGSWWGRAWIWVSIALLVLIVASMFYVARPYYLARDAKDDAELIQRLDRTRPLLAAWIGGIGIVALVALMVFKPF